MMVKSLVGLLSVIKSPRQQPCVQGPKPRNKKVMLPANKEENEAPAMALTALPKLLQPGPDQNPWAIL
jgi:hypothetical protein